MLICSCVPSVASGKAESYVLLLCYYVFKRYSVFQLISSASANSISGGRGTASGMMIGLSFGNALRRSASMVAVESCMYF